MERTYTLEATLEKSKVSETVVFFVLNGSVVVNWVERVIELPRGAVVRLRRLQPECNNSVAINGLDCGTLRYLFKV